MTMKRRDMLAGAAMVAGSQLLGSRATQAQTDRQRPLFTASNVNRFLRVARRRGMFEQVIAQASQNLPAFIRNQFRLTPTQEKLLAELRMDQRDLLTSAIGDLATRPTASLKMEVAELDSTVDSPLEFITESKTTSSSLLGLPDFGDIDIDIVIVCIKRKADVNETVDGELEDLARGL